MPGDQAARKLLGAWYTPPELIDVVVEGVLDGWSPPACGPVRVVDPACGDGRFLTAVADRLARDHPGVAVHLTGCDVDAHALAAVERVDVHRVHADALAHDWGDARFDLVVGNPPFLSQMATATTRGGSSRHGGGPYADAAAEFLALSLRLARPDGGRVGLVLPQSILGARDAAPVRERIVRDGDLTWSWWAPRQRLFDAQVHVCALGFRRPSTGTTTQMSFTGVVTDRLGIPTLDHGSLHTIGTLGDRAELNANFRDEYYALVPAVSDDADGPPLVTSGLIDPGLCHWGSRPVTFAKRTFSAPRVDLAKLTGRFPAWAARKLVPKVLVANQTRVIEAVADPRGEWLPGVPVSTATPTAGVDTERAVWELATVLTGPVAAIHAWQSTGGTGLSATTVRISPAVLASVPWPAGSLDAAIAALRNGDAAGTARAVTTAHGLSPGDVDRLVAWWVAKAPPM
jgi:N-6 DNA Methylase